MALPCISQMYTITTTAPANMLQKRTSHFTKYKPPQLVEFQGAEDKHSFTHKKKCCEGEQKMQNVEKKLQRSKPSQMKILLEAKQGECVPGCSAFLLCQKYWKAMVYKKKCL